MRAAVAVIPASFIKVFSPRGFISRGVIPANCMRKAQSTKGPSKWIHYGEVTLTNEHMMNLQSEREWIDDALIDASR